MGFNYKKLLIYYIEHVGMCEGVSFLGRSADDGIDGLTHEEVEELRRLSNTKLVEQEINDTN